jgi:predicted nucleotidyltransferase
VTTPLQRLNQQEHERREADRRQLLVQLRQELATLLPGATVWVFGSLVQPGRFGDYSDVDLALEQRPSQFSEYWLQGELEHRLGRQVDVLILPETRLRSKVESEGLQWTL